tara:strand:+ start:1966 stop:2145 length:180 start_codon:yes stop_codon:yes gene_type:complete
MGAKPERERNVSNCKWTVKTLKEDEEVEMNDHGDWRCEHGHKVLVWKFNNLSVTHTHSG